ncbi:MAG: prepilin-type N-terminal cleavage/methylation domain-containing protein [Phycisphaerae bacterium]
MKRLAFTLVEVLIVVIVLGILAAIVVPQFSSASTDAKLSALQSNLQIVRGQLQLYKIQHNDTWPALATFTAQMTGYSKVDGTTGQPADGFNLGPYLQQVPNNPYTNTNTIGNGAVGTSAWYYDAATGTFRANDEAGHTSY